MLEWLSANAFFLVILLLCLGMHLFGHGCHGGHRKHERSDRDAQRPTRANTHQH